MHSVQLGERSCHLFRHHVTCSAESYILCGVFVHQIAYPVVIVVILPAGFDSSCNIAFSRLGCTDKDLNRLNKFERVVGNSSQIGVVVT